MKKMGRPIQDIQESDTMETWNIAVQWVSENRRLIRRIASPYFRHMAGDNRDLFQEAAIAAFKALISSRKKGKPTQFVRFFRVNFKTNCIKLAKGVETQQLREDHQNSLGFERLEKFDDQELDRIQEAMKAVTTRQRQICSWLLKQPEPARTPDLAQEFNVSRRHACRLVSGSIQRISSGAGL